MSNDFRAMRGIKPVSLLVAPLPRLAMNSHFPLRPAVLLQFHPLRIVPLVLLGRVVAVTALRAFECDNRAVRFSLCHGMLLSVASGLRAAGALWAA